MPTEGRLKGEPTKVDSDPLPSTKLAEGSTGWVQVVIFHQGTCPLQPWSAHRPPSMADLTGKKKLFCLIPSTSSPQSKLTGPWAT